MKTRTLTLPTGETVRFETSTDPIPDEADYVDLATEGDDLEDEDDIEGAFLSYSDAVAALLRDYDAAATKTDGAAADDAETQEDLRASLVALLYNRAGLRVDLDDVDGALADLDAAVTLSAPAGVDGEDLADIYVRRADARYAASDTGGADADLATALGLWPDHALALNNRAAYRLEANDLDGALDDATEAARLDGTDALFLATLAEIHAARGDATAALAALERAADIDDVTPFLASEHFEAIRDDPRFIALIPDDDEG